MIRAAIRRIRDEQLQGELGCVRLRNPPKSLCNEVYFVACLRLERTNAQDPCSLWEGLEFGPFPGLENIGKIAAWKVYCFFLSIFFLSFFFYFKKAPNQSEAIMFFSIV